MYMYVFGVCARGTAQHSARMYVLYMYIDSARIEMQFGKVIEIAQFHFYLFSIPLKACRS